MGGLIIEGHRLYPEDARLEPPRRFQGENKSQGTWGARDRDGYNASGRRLFTRENENFAGLAFDP